MNDQETAARRFQRQRATFVSFKGNDQVEMLVGGRVLAIGKEDWLCLPPIDNLDAAGRALVAPMSG